MIMRCTAKQYGERIAKENVKGDEGKLGLSPGDVEFHSRHVSQVYSVTGYAFVSFMCIAQVHHRHRSYTRYNRR